MIVKQVDYKYMMQHQREVVACVTQAFLNNHKITLDAYNRTQERYRDHFVSLLNKCTEDMIQQIHQSEGVYIVAEQDEKIVAVSFGRPYGKPALSDDFVHQVFESQCCFHEVMSGWWSLMSKYQGLPPGKIFHQAAMGVLPEYAGRGIGEKICKLTATILEGYDGYAVETSSESSDLLALKMSERFYVFDLDTNSAGLTFRLHLRPTERAQQISHWFISKKEVNQQSSPVNVQAISTCGKHYHVGNIAVWDSDPTSHLPVLVMLHPNSASRLFFKGQMEDQALTKQYRLIAMDLPGHGDSFVAEDPHSTYTFSGYAQQILQAIKALQIPPPVVFGWSLGGHVAIEMMDTCKGIILSGAPPMKVSLEGFNEAFKTIDGQQARLISKRHFSHEEASLFAGGISAENWMVQYTLKADGRARERLFEWICANSGCDQRTIVAQSKVPIAIIAAENDPAARLEYLQSLQFGNLWGLHAIADCGHGVVFQKPELVNQILSRFLKDVYL